MHLILLLLLREVDAFEGEIASAVEDAISNKIRKGIIKLWVMESLQIYIPVYSIAVLNATCVGNPVLCNSSIEFEIKVLVTGTAKDAFIVSNYNHKGWRGFTSCSSPTKILRWIRSHYKKLSLIMYHSLLWCMLFHCLTLAFYF